MPDGTPMCFTASQLHSGAVARRRLAEADDACLLAFARAERLANLLDRHDGDNGEDADALRDITADIDRVIARVLALLGEPAKALVHNGRIVGLVRSAPR